MLVKQRDEFIGAASHELKTPVTSIKAYAQIVQQKLEEEEGDTMKGDLMVRLNAQVNRLATLINHMLDPTKISEGKLQLTLERLDLNELLKERVEEIRHTSSHVFALQTTRVPPVMAYRNRTSPRYSIVFSGSLLTIWTAIREWGSGSIFRRRSSTGTGEPSRYKAALAKGPNSPLAFRLIFRCQKK